MLRRLLAAALATIAMLGATACASDGQRTTAFGDHSTTRTPSATPTATASATPSASASAGPATIPDPISTTTQAAPPPPPPPQDNQAFCAAFAAAVDRADQLVDPAIVLENSTDLTAIEQAWQDIQRIALEGGTYARQAAGLAGDAWLESVAQIMATYYDQIAAAATARDKGALDAISQPTVPEPPPGTTPPCAN